MEGSAYLVLVQQERARIEGQAVILQAVLGVFAQPNHLAMGLFQHRPGIFDDQLGSFRQVVEERAHVRVEGWRQGFDAKERLARVDAFQDAAGLAGRVGRVIGRGQDAPARIRACAGHGFPDGVKHQAFDGAERALGGRIEQAQGLHVVAEKFDAHGVVVERGIDVDDRTAHGKGARVVHNLRAAKSNPQQVSHQRLPVEDRADLDGAAQLREGARRNHPPEQPGRRRDHDRRCDVVGQPVEQGKPLHGAAPVGLDFGVGAAFWRRQFEHQRRCQRIVLRVLAAQEELDGRLAGVDLLFVGNDVENRGLLGAYEVRGEGSAQGGNRPVDFEAERSRRGFVCELSFERGQQRLHRDGSLHGPRSLPAQPAHV